MVFLQFIHLLSLSVWMGALVFFSFIAAPAIFKTLPREMAGDVVGGIFPKYYQLGCLCGVFSLGSLALLSSHTGDWHGTRIIILAFMTLITFCSAFVIGPRVRQLKTALRAMDTQNNDTQESKRFRRLHGFSMILNLLVLTALDFQTRSFTTL